LFGFIGRQVAQHAQFVSVSQAVTLLQHAFFAHRVQALSPAAGAQVPPLELDALELDELAVDELAAVVVVVVVVVVIVPPPHGPAHGPLPVVQVPSCCVVWSGKPHCP